MPPKDNSENLFLQTHNTYYVPALRVETENTFSS